MAKSSFFKPLVAMVFVAALAIFFTNPKPLRADSPAPSAPTKIIFNRDIRSILSDRCFPCHGFDNNKRQSGLRLDTKSGAFDPLPKHTGKRAFVPGNLAESYAYQRMISTDPKEVMPPATSHLKMNDAERNLFRLWIEQGAKWEEHWAFVKPVRPEVPAVQNKSWPRNDIDRFILARLEEEGLKPSPEADKPTLIRRLSLDLTGLPPTPAEVDAFVNDPSANAYETLVDRLLASPHYGEQMATHWLDEARYADSHGFQSDPERHQWHWRDWVIKTFNNNMPYDEFIVEQLAGDLLPNATEDQKIATGFSRNHRMNSEGGIIDEEWRVETVIDRVETTSGSMLGLTLGCCRCHDHKFDPITQKEFYSFCAYFNSINERGEYFSVGLDKGINGAPVMKVLSPDTTKRLAELEAAVKKADARVAEFKAKVPEMEKQFVASGAKLPEPTGAALRFPLNGTVDGIDTAGKTVPAKFTLMAGGPTTQPSYIKGKLPGKAVKFDGRGEGIDAGDVADYERTDSFSVGAWVFLQSADGSILNKMTDAPLFRGFDLFLQGGKVAPHFVSNWPQNALKVVTGDPLPMKQWVHVLVTYNGSGKPEGVRVYVNGQQQGTTTETDALHEVPGEVVGPPPAGKRPYASATMRSGAPLLIGRRSKDSYLRGSVQDVRFYNRVLTPVEAAALGVGPDLQQLVKVPVEKRTPQQNEKLAAALLGPLPEYNQAVADREKPKAEMDTINNDPGNTTMIMEELPKPRDTFVLIRGQYDHHGDKVEPGVPAVLNPMPKGESQNRLGLAHWIATPDNPLTARVRVNRLWEKFFGIGIVKTTENFGTQAAWPSNPELLDYLATEFVAQKWNLKAIQKEMVMSAAYRQSSNITPELLERDPENRLVARGPRFRLAAEEVRDQALAVSGLLVDKLGGPSVKPYEPANLWDGNLFGNLSKYTVDAGDKLYRRSLYMFLKRTAAPPNMMVFDMPSREYCVVKRSRTNTPLQALDLMNDPTYVEAARSLAQRMLIEGGKSESDRIAYAFHRATCRAPSAAESQILQEQLTNMLEHFKKDPDAATKLLAIGSSPRDAKLNAPELAAYTMTASVILNLDEMINKQ